MEKKERKKNPVVFKKIFFPENLKIRQWKND